MPENPKDPKTQEKQRKYLRFLKEILTLIKAAEFGKAQKRVARLEEAMDGDGDLLDFSIDDEDEES
jgi:hypothetical protein